MFRDSNIISRLFIIMGGKVLLGILGGLEIVKDNSLFKKVYMKKTEPYRLFLLTEYYLKVFKLPSVHKRKGKEEVIIIR